MISVQAILKISTWLGYSSGGMTRSPDPYLLLDERSPDTRRRCMSTAPVPFCPVPTGRRVRLPRRDDLGGELDGAVRFLPAAGPSRLKYCGTSFPVTVINDRLFLQSTTLIYVTLLRLFTHRQRFLDLLIVTALL